MRRVFIMEKPDMALGMAQFFWGAKAVRQKKNTHYEGQYDGMDTVVTWAYGHILSMPMPEAYGEQFKEWKQYPCFPEVWKKVVSPSTKEQFKAIKELVAKADLVINGGDPDREGQLLVDEILEYVRYKGKVQRILVNAKDDVSVRRAYETMCPNDKYHNLYLAGLARQRADWLVGMNLSRAYTVNAQRSGKCPPIRFGRVKIPTLCLVVQREREIKDFQPVAYFLLHGFFDKDGSIFKASLVPEEDAPIDADNHILSKKYLLNIVEQVRGKEAVVVKAEKKAGTEAAPLPYSLDTLQVEANKRFGFSPKTVLDTVQSIYEKKFVTYPRSDCNYLPESQHGDAADILKTLSQYEGLGQAAQGADPSIKGKAFNGKKVEQAAHHAIIPTGVKATGLSGVEEKIYRMIALRYILQFYPPCKFNKMEVLLSVGEYTFKASGKTVTDKGWRAVLSGEEKDSKDVVLPEMKVNERLQAVRYEIEDKMTTPPVRFTEGTLLAAMTNIWKFVSPDNPNREKLKECKGIGTPATRDTIIAELMETKGGKLTPYISKEGKELVPTDFGMAVVDNIDVTFTKPDFTAVMEYNLTEITEGKRTLESYMQEIKQIIGQNIEFAEKRNFNLPGLTAEKKVVMLQCPICKQQTLARRFSSNTKRYFWICTDRECHTKRTVFYDDYRNKPLIRICPECKSPLKHVFSKKKNKYYWFCEKCNEFKNIT